MRSIVKHISIVLLSLTAVVLIKTAIDPAAEQDDSPFALFPIAVVVSAWYGGTAAGLLCTVLAAIVCDFLFAVPRYSLWMDHQAHLFRSLEFLAEGAFISLLTGALQRARQQSDEKSGVARRALLASEEAVRKLNLEKAARSATELRLRRLVDSNVIAVFVAERNGRVLDANGAFLRLAGSSRIDVENGELNWRQLTPADWEDADREAIAEIDRNGRCTPYEKEFLRPGNVRVPVMVGAAALEHQSRLICFALDMTEQKEFENELANSKVMADAANRQKSEFLANISHELRTPMNAIIGMTDLALEEELSPAVRDYLETMRDSADTLLNLLNDLLDFSRIEVGKFKLVAEPFRLAAVLQEALRSLATRASEKNLELVCDVDSSIPSVLVGDGRRLRQIVLNLLGNAIKFTERGEIVVAARAETRDEERLSLEISVIDTGIGIDPEDQERIFAPFTQVDATSTRQYSGTGLGLAICHELATRMGGQLGVESEPGRGSRFYCRLPFDVADDSAEHDERLLESAARLAGCEVLVVDAHESSRRVATDALAAFSMQATATSNTDSALDELRRRHAGGSRFTATLFDATTSGGDGLALLERIRAEGLPSGAVILTSAAADRKSLGEDGRAFPIDAFLEKPFVPESLLDALVTACYGPKRHADVNDAARTASIRLKVLLVEDTPANQKVVETILTKRGHDVTVVVNGQEAIEHCRRDDYDVVLMDVQMPKIDGLRATQAIRTIPDPWRSQVPIIAMTAHAMAGDRRKCLSAGMDDYIAKPIDARRLIRLVERPRRQHASLSAADTISDQARTTTVDTPQGQPVHDRSAALERLGGNEQLYRDMARFFLEDSPKLLSQMADGFEQNEPARVERAAHSLKGLASNFDATQVIASAGELEAMARNGDLSQAAPLLSRLPSEVAQLQDALRRQL